jgi:hypothetical protein
VRPAKPITRTGTAAPAPKEIKTEIVSYGITWNTYPTIGLSDRDSYIFITVTDTEGNPIANQALTVTSDTPELFTFRDGDTQRSTAIREATSLCPCPPRPSATTKQKELPHARQAALLSFVSLSPTKVMAW